MKRLGKSLLIAITLVISMTSSAQDIEQVVCNDFWAQVDFDALGLSLSHFDLRGEVDICHADSNNSYPYDELIYITLYNSFEDASAIE